MRLRWVQPAAGYVGAVVGAGFASGREVQHFFAAHGPAGLAGAAVAGALFALAGAVVLHRVSTGNLRHYGALLRNLCGPLLGGAMDRVGTVLLCAGLVVVLAGGGALGGLVFGWPRLAGVLFLGGLLLATEVLGRRAHAAVNLAVLPLLVVTCVVAALHPAQGAGSGAALLAPAMPWVLAAILYVAYNLVLGVAGLCVAADPRLSPGEAAFGGAVGGVALGLLCGGVVWVLLAGAGASAELPLAGALGPGLWRLVGYPLTVLLALWTTGAATVGALGARVAAGRRWAGPFAVACAMPFACFGLVGVVATLYPLLGYLGLPLLAVLCAHAARGLWVRARGAR